VEATIQAIVSGLLLYINAVMAVPDSNLAQPQVKFLSQSQMEAKACESRSCKVEGWFAHADQTIYLHDQLDVRRDLHARSILLHELVHYVQHKQNGIKKANECLSWKARETQAYRIQYKWLYENHVPPKTPINLAFYSLSTIRCPPPATEIPEVSGN